MKRFGPTYDQIDNSPFRYGKDGSRPAAYGHPDQWPEYQRNVTAGDAAELSRIAYVGTAERNSEFEKTNLTNKFTYDEADSNKDVAVFDHAATGKKIVAYRGTNVYDDADLVADGQIVLGGAAEKSGRFANNKRKIEQLGGPDNVELVTGHSLGGRGADLVSRQYGIRAVTFNEGTSPGINPLNNVFKKSNPNLTTYTTGIDPFSVSNIFTQRKGVNVYAPNRLNVHAIENYTTGKNRQKLDNKVVVGGIRG